MRIVTAMVVGLTCSMTNAQIYIQPYYGKNGVLHEGHYRSEPNQN